jgi:arsenate reductase-like glutaredoxin family protein
MRVTNGISSRESTALTVAIMNYVETLKVKDVRSRTMQDNPDKSFQQVAAMVGKRWKELSDQERAPYRNQALLDSERFQREKLDILIADTQKIVSSMKGGNSSSGV